MDLKDITYLTVNNKLNKTLYLFFDFCEDTSIEQSSEITDSPIDAINGTSLQERKALSMINIGVSGSFSNRNSGRSFTLPDNSEILFLNSNRRLENVVNWLEDAIENSTVFTVCKKGVVYHNQLLNSLSWTMDESYSTIDVSLSFIEMEIVDTEEYNIDKNNGVDKKQPEVLYYNPIIDVFFTDPKDLTTIVFGDPNLASEYGTKFLNTLLELEISGMIIDKLGSDLNTKRNFIKWVYKGLNLNLKGQAERKYEEKIEAIVVFIGTEEGWIEQKKAGCFWWGIVFGGFIGGKIAILSEAIKKAAGWKKWW